MAIRTDILGRFKIFGQDESVVCVALLADQSVLGEAIIANDGVEEAVVPSGHPELVMTWRWRPNT